MAINSIWNTINKADVSIRREGNRTIVQSKHFKPLPVKICDAINTRIENEMKTDMVRRLGDDAKLISASELRKQVQDRMTPVIFNNVHDPRGLVSRVQDMFPGMGLARSMYGNGWYNAQGYTANAVTGNGQPGVDPAKANYTVPNLWISPYEACSIYSQGGLPALIIRKKSQSVLLNGVKIKNPYLTADELDIVRNDAVRLSLINEIARGMNWSLVYGGSLVFPMFKKDSPLSMSLPVPQLLKLGIIKKGCIERFVTLDRWSTIHIPQWNPTAADFLNPDKFFVTFLGCDVDTTRCARIVTLPQAGYLGTLMNLGWGTSDLCSWYESVLQYMSVMNSIPTMINQMSILARTINVDGILATEGELILDEVARHDTIRVRESSNVNDPINLDVIGDLQAIKRDFNEVPALVRLIRQDFCARAGIPEEMILSSEKGAFARGGDTKGTEDRQWEAIKYTHREVAEQLKNIMMLVIIDALGTDEHVLKALPYTTIEFDNPALTGAQERGEFFKNITAGYFNEVSGLMPPDSALELAAAVGDSDLPISSDVVAQLKEKQKKLDEQADEKHNLEMELLRAQIESAKAGAKAAASNPVSGASQRKPKEEGSGNSHNYDNRLERKQHNVVSPGKTEVKRLDR